MPRVVATLFAAPTVLQPAMSDLATLKEYQAAAEEVARLAGKLIRDAHEARATGGLQIQSKGSATSVDLVTATDQAAEKLIIDTIRARYPDHAFIGEESAFAQGSAAPGSASASASPPLALGDAPTWIIDPLDGTTNFVHGYPLVTVSIGVAVAKELAVGVIYNPLMDELCSAVRGGGATLNGRPCAVGAASGVGDALIVNNVGASRKPGFNQLCTDRLLALLDANVRGLRNSGSAAQNMMHVACGRLDAYFEDGFGGPWDVAAGAVIVQEAGGVVRMVKGEPFELRAGKGQVLCGNAAVVDDIAKVIREVPERHS